MNVLFNLIKSGLWPILKPILTLFLSKAGRACLDLAKEYVKQAMSQDGWTDEEKRQFVRDRIKEHSGDFGDSLINLAIEVAVRYLKAR